MKTKHIIYPAILMLMLGIPLLRYYSTTPEINGCVLEYVDNLEESNYKGYMYELKEGVRHIEPGNSTIASSLKEFQIGKSNGCIMASDNLFADLNNTFYCTVTYLIRKSPLPDKLKEPLKILKSE